MKAVSLNAFSRSLSRRAGAKRLRSRGRVPAVIYGRGAESRNLEVDSKVIEDLIHHSASETILVDLAVAGDEKATQLAFVQEVQHHPLTGRVLHVDFHQVREDEKVTVNLPVETVGEAAGVKDGGVLEHVLFRVKVRGLPKDLPEVIEVDVSHLGIGQAIHLGEIKLPEGVLAVGDAKVSVVAVAAPLTEAQEQAAAEAVAVAPTEPEMLKEKKEGTAAEAEAKPAKSEAKPAEKAAEKKK
jgi:large subunit ribosomal protein L25